MAWELLSWNQVEPRRFPFDATPAAELVRSLEPAPSVPPPLDRAGERPGRPWTGNQWVAEMTGALVTQYGVWARDWKWSRTDGGVVDAWCCAEHSITTPAETLDRVATALVQWRSWLETLADTFEEFPVPPDRPAEERLLTWYQGVTHLVTMVVERTQATDAWDGHCHVVLTWFLNRWDVPHDRAQRLIEDAIAWQFRGWTTPSQNSIEEFAASVAESLTDDPAAT